MFFNGEGFHNHINHALLTLWCLGAPPSAIQRSYDLNRIYQRPQHPSDAKLSLNLADPDTFTRSMGNDQSYKAFLDFFSQEIAKSSWQEVVQKYLFAQDKRAESMLVRLFDSFLHPVIHLGLGIEFEQPAIIAEALAQTACHQDWISELLLPSEALSKSSSTSISAPDLLEAIRADDEILQAPHWDDHDKIREGLLARAQARMIDCLSKIKVDPEDLPARTAEMINTAAYLTAGAQRPGKEVKFDFYLLHCLTSAVFFRTFLAQPWLSASNKARLLEWKIRMDAVMYASRKSPQLHLDIIRSYRTKKPCDWSNIQRRVCFIPDDGHAAKVVRALSIGEEICKPFEQNDACRLKNRDWHQLALMAIDSVELEHPAETVQFDGPGEMWVRSAGFDEAWTTVPSIAIK